MDYISIIAGSSKYSLEHVTLAETNKPLEICQPKRKCMFQPSIFSEHVSFREGIAPIYIHQNINWYHTLPKRDFSQDIFL